MSSTVIDLWLRCSLAGHHCTVWSMLATSSVWRQYYWPHPVTSTACLTAGHSVTSSTW